MLSVTRMKRPLLVAPSMTTALTEEPETPVVAPGVDTAFAVQTGRKTFFQSDLDTYEKMGEKFHPFEEKELTDNRYGNAANLISSELPNGMHKPVIDCDYPVIVMESSTPGHGHLYIEQELTWPQYQALLEGFYKAGLIQKLWYENALADKRTYVRLPHIRKPKKSS